MEAKSTILTKQQVRQALINAKCPEELITKIGEDILIWWKAGWIQEILLAQAEISFKAGIKEAISGIVKFMDWRSGTFAIKVCDYCEASLRGSKLIHRIPRY